MIDRFSPEKIYVQIIRAIEIDIQDGFEPGDLYLSENTLAEKFGVNRHTVRRAVEELVKQGLLLKRHGFGTFVSEKRLAYRVKSYQRLSAALDENNIKIETILLSKNVIDAVGGVAEKLQLKLAEPVIQIDTLRKIEGKEVALISHFIPKEACPLVLEQYESGSLGNFLSNVCQVQPKRLLSFVSAAMPTAEDGFRLGLSTSQPILKVKTINEDSKTGIRIEYSITRFRADMIQLEMLMNP
jgi:GntR family phosphonate transport system transcriptional regulator